MIDIKSTFSKRLKELRIENNLTQNELSEATGISQTGIAKWETGERSPSVEYLVELSLYFQCSIEYMLGLVD